MNASCLSSVYGRVCIDMVKSSGRPTWGWAGHGVDDGAGYGSHPLHGPGGAAWTLQPQVGRIENTCKLPSQCVWAGVH